MLTWQGSRGLSVSGGAEQDEATGISAGYHYQQKGYTTLLYWTKFNKHYITFYTYKFKKKILKYQLKWAEGELLSVKWQFRAICFKIHLFCQKMS